jgi:hypothetical protein
MPEDKTTVIPGMKIYDATCEIGTSTDLEKLSCLSPRALALMETSLWLAKFRIAGGSICYI